jgi:hypothetical protein
MSGRKVSPIARSRASKAGPSTEPPKPAAPAAASSSKVSPIARAREGTKKGERRPSPGKGPASKVSPIARARASKSPQLVHKDLEVVDDDDDYEFPPLSVPFGLECYLTKTEIAVAEKFVRDNAALKFQLYTVDYDEESKDKKKEYEAVLVFGWFRPAVGVDIHDIWQAWQEKEQKWYEFLRTLGLMGNDPAKSDVRYPEMLDPVEEEPEEDSN